MASSADACEPSWGTYYAMDEAQAWLDLDRRIARRDQRGGDVVVSFGGQLNDAPLAVWLTVPVAPAGLTPEDKVGATPMVGQNDVAGEVFTLDDAKTVNRFATSHGAGRMSMWSLNRDKTCGSNYPDVRRVSDSCSGVEQGETRTRRNGGRRATARRPRRRTCMRRRVAN